MRRRRWLDVGILVLAAFMLIRHVYDLSMWYDEAWAVFHSSGTLEQVALKDRDILWPPGYFVLLHGWMKLVGMNDLAVRMMNALAGMLGTACLIRAGRALHSDRAGWLAGTAWAVSSYAIYFLIEVRSYSLILVLAAALIWFQARWVKRPTWQRAIPLALVLGGLFYLHYVYTVAFIGLTGLWTLFAVPRRQWPRWIAAVGAAGVLALPLLPDMVDFYRTRPTSVKNPESLFLHGPSLWFRAYSAHQDVLWGAILVLALTGLVVGFRRAARASRAGWSVLAIWGVAIPAVIYLNRAHLLMYTTRYLVFTVPALLLLVGIGLANLRREGALVGAALLLVYVAVPWQPFDHRRAYTESPPVRDLVRELAQRWQPGDVLLVDPQMPRTMEEPCDWWYYEKIYFPGGRIPRVTHVEQAGSRVWYLVRQGRQDEATRRAVETGRVAIEFWGPWYFIATLYQSPPLEEGVPVGETLRFRGYDPLDTLLYHPGDTVAVRTWWSVAAPLDRDYSLGLHLVDAHGNLIAQNDSGPTGRLTPSSTSQWQPEGFYRDERSLRLPWCLHTGTYQLQIVVYGWWDNQRLPIADGAWRGPDDSLLLEPITVTSFAECDK